MNLRRMMGMLAVLLGLISLPQASLAHEVCRIGMPGETARVTVADTGRTMMFHRPADAAEGAPLPLVFLLHGSGGNGADMLKSTGLEATADKHGFIVAAPDAGIPLERGYVWNIPGVPTVTGEIPGPEDADDVAFFGTAIDWLAEQGCIARDQVYATGLSGGGRMTSWLGCTASDRFAAIAPVVGLRAGNPDAENPQQPDPATCNPDHTMPVFAFAGGTDTVNPPGGGGAGFWQYSMDAALKRWAELGECSEQPQELAITENVTETRYNRCSKCAWVIGRIVGDRGHEWVADNDAMWSFFSNYRR